MTDAVSARLSRSIEHGDPLLFIKSKTKLGSFHLIAVPLSLSEARRLGLPAKGEKSLLTEPMKVHLISDGRGERLVLTPTPSLLSQAVHRVGGTEIASASIEVSLNDDGVRSLLQPGHLQAGPLTRATHEVELPNGATGRIHRFGSNGVVAVLDVDHAAAIDGVPYVRSALRRGERPTFEAPTAKPAPTGRTFQLKVAARELSRILGRRTGVRSDWAFAVKPGELRGVTAVIHNGQPLVEIHRKNGTLARIPVDDLGSVVQSALRPGSNSSVEVELSATDARLIFKDVTTANSGTPTDVVALLDLRVGRDVISGEISGVVSGTVCKTTHALPSGLTVDEYHAGHTNTVVVRGDVDTADAYKLLGLERSGALDDRVQEVVVDEAAMAMDPIGTDSRPLVIEPTLG